MNPNEILRLVDSLRRERNIDPEFIFQAIEDALATAIRRQQGEEKAIEVTIDRESGQMRVTVDGEALDPDTIGRIGAQMAKQVMIQRIREATRDAVIADYQQRIGTIVVGTVVQVGERRRAGRVEPGLVAVQLPGEVEAILPRSEQIPGTTHRVGERVRAVVVEARPDRTRVKVVLSRTRPQFVQRLFEQEIPEIADGVIQIKAIAREAGNRTKVAVTSDDPRVDCVGACVGIRGNRIKNILNELPGERIDIVQWYEDLEQWIPEALQPAEVDQVLVCEMIGRAIVLVREDQLSLAIGRKGQNVRLASKLCGIDIEIMTEEELNEQIERAVIGFSQNIDGMTEEIAQSLVEQGYLSYDDLAVIEPEDLMEIGNLTAEEVDHIVEQATRLAEEAERAAEESRRRERTDQPAAPEPAAAAQAGSGIEESAEAGRAAEATPTADEADDQHDQAVTAGGAPDEPPGPTGGTSDGASDNASDSEATAAEEAEAGDEAEDRVPAESEPTEMGTE